MGTRKGTTRDTAKAHAALTAKWDARKNGRAFDEAFKSEKAALQQHIRENFPTGYGDLMEMVDQGADILRSIAYDKKSSQLLGWDSDIKEEDQSLPYEKQVYSHLYMDAAAKNVVSIAKRVHLTEPLVRFEVRALEAAIDWAEHNPQNFEWLDILKNELEQRRAGKDTFELPKPARKKAGPKPKAYHQMLAAAAKPEPETTPPSFIVPENFEL
jgi:hypothetical protein